MNIKDVIEFLAQSYTLGRKFRLENIRALLRELGDPQRRLKVIHVAGTNGKGSVCASLYYMILEAGYSAGFFSSPHLYSYLERYRYNGKQISENDFCAMMERVKEAVEATVAKGSDHPTEFEILTALAYLFFEAKGLEYAVMEVGLGGRLDATNAIEEPVATVITPLSLEHTEYLGHTIEEIAREKAGIIKQRVPIITSSQPEAAMRVIEQIASEMNAPLIVADGGELLENTFEGIRLRLREKEYHFSLAGSHQLTNAVLALETMEVLRKNNCIDIDEEEIRRGLKNVKWPGRIEKINDSPPVYIDGAHNPAAALALQDMLKGKKAIAVLGMLAEKDVEGVLDILVPMFEQIIVTRPVGERAVEAEAMASMVRERGREVIVEKDIEKAMSRAMSLAQEGEIILATGSFYLIGEVRELFHPSRRNI